METYRTADNDAFNNLLWDLSQDLIKGKTTVGFVGRHKDSFDSFARLTADIQILTQHTNVNSSGTRVPIEYIPYTSVEWVEQSKSKEQLGTHVTCGDGYDGFGAETGALSPGPSDIDELDVQDEEQDEEHEDHDRFYMSQDHRSSSHRSNAPMRHARTNARTGAPQTRRLRFQRERAPPSVGAWGHGRKAYLRRGVDRQRVGPAFRLLYPPLR